MADATQTPPETKKDEKQEVEEVEVKGENYTFASLSDDPDFDDLVNNLSKILEVDPFSKTSGIPSLEYFNREMNRQKDNTLQPFVKACEESLDTITHMPAPKKTLGAGKYNIRLDEIPNAIQHIENIHSALVYFRGICGYQADEPKVKEVKSLTMQTLSEVQTPKQKREAKS